MKCVILSRLHRPGVIWRFFRRMYFYQLNKKIEALPKVVLALGKKHHHA